MNHEEFYVNHLPPKQQFIYYEYKQLYNNQSGYLKRLYMDLSVALHRAEEYTSIEILKLTFIM